MVDSIFHIIDDILFLYMCLSSIYLLVFALTALMKRKDSYATAKQQLRFVLLLPSGSSVGEQSYPADLYTTIYYDDLFQTVSDLDENQYNIVVILGETDHASPGLLHTLNKAFNSGTLAIQLHHIIEKRVNRKLQRQAINEEVRNSIFKCGHAKNGLSSVLDKVDIAIDMHWLKNNLKSNKTNLESRLLRQNIFIDYLEDMHVYSTSPREKARSMSKWKAISKLPTTLLEANWDYADKLFRQLLPSWKMMIIITLIGCLVTGYYDWTISFKWGILLFGILFTVSLAIPDYLIKKK